MLSVSALVLFGVVCVCTTVVQRCLLLNLSFLLPVGLNKNIHDDNGPYCFKVAVLRQCYDIVGL